MSCFELFALIVDIKKRTNCRIEISPLYYSPPYAIEIRATYNDCKMNRIILETELLKCTDTAFKNMLDDMVKTVIEMDARARNVQRGRINK